MTELDDLRAERDALLEQHEMNAMAFFDVSARCDALRARVSRLEAALLAIDGVCARALITGNERAALRAIQSLADGVREFAQ